MHHHFALRIVCSIVFLVVVYAIVVILRNDQRQADD